MAIINQATKELQVKIVYYGPAMGGKTTNLVQVHDHVQTAAGNVDRPRFADTGVQGRREPGDRGRSPGDDRRR